MNTSSMNPCRYELRFQPLGGGGEGLSFPCDAQGHVDLDGLSDRDRHTYLYARAVMGRDLTVPAVRPQGGH